MSVQERILSFILPAVAACLVLAAGCKKPDTSGKVVLRMLCGPDIGGSVKEIIKNFEGVNPGIKVEMIEGPAATNTREDMYSTAFLAEESTYDMVYMDVIWVPKFAGRGWLRPLDDFFDSRMQSEFLPGDVEASKYEGNIYRVPIQSDAGMLYYRKDLLEKHGLQAPKTWDELVSIAKKLQKPPELLGFVFQGKQYEGIVCNFLELLWGNNGAVLNSKGEVVLDKPEAAEALQWMSDAINKHKISSRGVLTYQEEEARHIFQQGKAVFMRNWPYAWTLLNKDESPVKGKVGIIPMVHGKCPSCKSAAALGGWGYGISAFSKHPQEARKFILFSASPQSQKIMCLRSGLIPARKSLFNDPAVLKANPHYPDLFRVLMKAKPRPVHAMYARMSDIMQVHISAVLSGREKPAAALRSASKEISAVINRK